MMNRVGTVILILCSCVVLAEAQTAPRNIQLPTLPRKPGLSQIPDPPHAAATRLAATATENVIPATCPPQAVGAVCGYVQVPLDRRHPEHKKIQIYFELYAHSNPGPAVSAILANFGGPGVTTTGIRGGPLFIFGPNMDAHDLLLIDDRGTGLSTAIDCKELQHGTEPFEDSVADCAAQLGDAASFYGDGDIAQDADAVRAALGYDLVDYFGASYGGLDASAYATRFGKHLRSVVLDAPYGTPALEPFAIEKYRTKADSRVVPLDCLRSPTCSLDHPHPRSDFDDLVEDLRLHPIEGETHDASGNLVHVRMDEQALLNYVVHNVDFDFSNIGELLAAGASVEHGDTAPLLRLEAEGFFTLVGDSGDPTFSSSGAYYATGCVNAEQPWDWSEPVSERKEQYAEAVSDLPHDFFAPYSRAAATGLLFSHFGKECLSWQNPEPPSPVEPAHAIYPHVPTLILEGDLDNRVPLQETSEVAELFPNSISVTVAEAGHETVNYSPCATTLVSQFIENLQAGDTSCASTPTIVWPAVGRFPLLVKDARPAEVDPSGSNQIDLAERKTVSVALAAALDALKRSLLALQSSVTGSVTGVGLRGGTFQTVFFGATSYSTTTLNNCSFATDLIVNGTLIWGYDNSILADLTVSGPGTAGGSLHVTGFWENPGPVGNFNVTGTLGGKQVAVLVPEA
jgi:pimeloyl-ACP methyl ester carboxylesterase